MRNNQIYCFVILHYKTIEDTDKCIQSILQLNESLRARIVVLDNGSNNGSGEKLQKKYAAYDNIKIVISDYNLGFSNGNNYAYSIAKTEYDPDFMIVCNSDIIFAQRSTLELISEIHEETRFNVLGPDIYIPKVKFHANPLAQRAMTYDEIEHEIEINKGRLKNIEATCRHEHIQEKKIQLINWTRTILRQEREIRPAMENVVLQGACYIFDSEYIKKKNRIFYPMESFYFEEYFVYADCVRNNYKTVYDPRIQVIHNESSATKKEQSDELMRKRFKLTNLIESMTLYCEVFRNGN